MSTNTSAPPAVEPTDLGWRAWPDPRDGVGAPLLSVVTVVRRDFGGLTATTTSLRPLLALPGVELVVVEGDDRVWPESELLRNQLVSEGFRVKWCTMPDGGIYDAMNRGVLAAQGEWIWFVNAEDTLSGECRPDRLLVELASMPETVLWAVGGVQLYSIDREPFAVARFESVEGIRTGDAPICHQGVLVRRQGFALTGLFDTGYRISADYRGFLQLCESGAPGVIAMTLVDFRQSGPSTMLGALRDRENLRAREQILTRPWAVRLHDHVRCAWRQLRSRRDVVPPG